LIAARNAVVYYATIAAAALQQQQPIKLTPRAAVQPAANSAKVCTLSRWAVLTHCADQVFN